MFTPTRNAAKYLIRTIFNDSSQANDKSQKGILERLDRVVSLGEDVGVDLRKNNGSIPKFDEFWGIVENEINHKTAVDDRRHNNVDEEGNVVVNMAMALSYRDLYRTCVTKAKNAEDADSPIPIPTYTWFLLQFWPCT